MFTLLPRLISKNELKYIIHNKIHINAIYYDTNTIICAKRNKVGTYLTDEIPLEYRATHVLGPGPSFEIYKLDASDLKLWTIKHTLNNITTQYLLPYSMTMIGKIIHL